MVVGVEGAEIGDWGMGLSWGLGLGVWGVVAVGLDFLKSFWSKMQGLRYCIEVLRY